MIKIKILPCNAFMVNMYILSDETGECVIVDAACYTPNEKKLLDDYISKNNLKPIMLINTHCHVDHVLGSRHVVDTYKIPFKIHSQDMNLITSAQKHGVVFGFNVEEPPMVTDFLEEGIDVKFGTSVLKVLHVPGHSPGSVAFFNEEQQFVIVGDVLFKGSIGRTDLPGGNYDVLINAIRTKLLVLPPDTEVLSGHGPISTIQEEILTNPFLDN